MVYVLLAAGFLCSALVTAAVIPFIRAISHKNGWVDEPDGKRKLHSRPTATAGGVAIAVGFLAGLIYIYAIRDFLPFSLSVPSAPLWFGGIVILLTGLYDDVRGLGFKHKFFAQVAVAFILIHAGFRVDTSGWAFLDLDPYNQALYSISLTMLWVVGVMNAVNLIDGLDGLAGGVVLIAFTSLGIVFGIQGGVSFVIMALLITGALAAFLAYNFNPASIFMGDSGSLFLGFLLAAYSLQGPMHADPLLATLIPVVVLGFPVADTGLSIIRRFARRQAVCSPDRDHIHHRLMLRCSTRKSVLILYTVALCFGTVAVLMTVTPAPLALALFTMVFLLVGAGIRMLGYNPVHDLRLLYTRPTFIEVREAEAVTQVAANGESKNADNERSEPSPVPDGGAEGDGMRGTRTPFLSFPPLFNRPTAMISKDSVVTLKKDVTSANLDGESVLLNLKTGSYFSVNDVGTSILTLIQEPKPIAQVVENLLHEFEVSHDQLEDDVLGFLREMKEQQLIQVADTYTN